MSARWRALGGIFFLLLVGLLTAPAEAAWRRAESENFIIYGDISESGLRRRVEQLEDFDRLLRMMTSVDAPPAANKLHVYIVSGLDDLRVLRPVASGTGGFYAATPDGIAAIVDGRAPAERNEILFHEYAHHFMMQYAPSAYPAWYVEGFAEYFMTASFAPERVEVGRASPGRAYSIVLDRWLPAERVLFEDASGLSLEQRGRFYAQSWLTAHYFFSNTERRNALQRYLAGIRTGDPRAAFRTATGIDPAEFNETLEDYIAGGRINFRRLTREAPAPVAVAITAMPPSADDLILYEAALRLGVAEENRASYLQRIRAAAADYQDDPYAMRVLAHAEALFGDGAAADRLLDPLIAASPDDAELLYIEGMRHLVAAEHMDDGESEARVARQWFGRAHDADGNHFQTLFRYAQSQSGSPGYVSENNSNILLLAHSLAPQVATITMNAAALLMSRGAFADAAAMLAPLAADPHDAGLASAAGELRQQALARAGATDTAGEAGSRKSGQAGD